MRNGLHLFRDRWKVLSIARYSRIGFDWRSLDAETERGNMEYWRPGRGARAGDSLGVGLPLDRRTIEGAHKLLQYYSQGRDFVTQKTDKIHRTLLIFLYPGHSPRPSSGSPQPVRAPPYAGIRITRNATPLCLGIHRFLLDWERDYPVTHLRRNSFPRMQNSTVSAGPLSEAKYNSSPTIRKRRGQ